MWPRARGRLTQGSESLHFEWRRVRGWDEQLVHVTNGDKSTRCNGWSSGEHKCGESSLFTLWASLLSSHRGTRHQVSKAPPLNEGSGLCPLMVVHSRHGTHPTVILTSVEWEDSGGQAREWGGVIRQGVFWYFLSLGIQAQPGQILHLPLSLHSNSVHSSCIFRGPLLKSQGEKPSAHSGCHWVSRSTKTTF